MNSQFHSISYQDLAYHLNFNELTYHEFSSSICGEDDLKVLGNIFKTHNPKRHLEFGTWMGKGVLACLDNCDATVWTLNKPFGENKPNGEYAYGHDLGDEDIIAWGKKLNMKDNHGYYKTDSLGFIGKEYLNKDMGHRVCQIYSQSDVWDTTNYPEGFFDSVFIDGGHTKEIVTNDTLKSLPLLAKGGLMIWHDYIPQKGKISSCDGVIDAIDSMQEFLAKSFNELYYIEGTLILIGRKK